MTTDQLGAALRDLVDDVDDGVPPPAAAGLWAGGRRRRRTARLVPALAAACVVALVALAVWPTGGRSLSVPAVHVDSDGVARLTAYPDVIAKPPFPAETATPGVTAALVPDRAFPDDLADPAGGTHVYAISPAGAVRRVTLPPNGSGLHGAPSLSPDGRWVARGPVLTDLVTGAAVPSSSAQAALGRGWAPPDQPAWWSPDSRRVFAGGFDEEQPRFAGVVVGTDGTVTNVPLVEEGLVPVVAGWLDDDTLLAFLDVGPDEVRLRGRTWSIGDDAWRPTTGAIALIESADQQRMRVQLSPDRTRLLLALEKVDVGGSGQVETAAMMFDPLTGAQLGMPSFDDGTVKASSWGANSFVAWTGWGCASAWHDGVPVVTDGEVRGFVDTSRNGVIDGKAEYGLVDVSSGYGEPCVAFAGDELRGTPVTNHLALWQERLWTWGVPILGTVLVALALWGWSRRRRGTPRPPIRRLRPIITQPF
jgi:hypothetical protein